MNQLLRNLWAALLLWLLAGLGSTVSAQGHSLFIQPGGSLWAWGNNQYGQLGDGTTQKRLTPVAVLAGTQWQAVSMGPAHSAAIRQDGSLWTWGNNERGQLGNGTTTNALVPVSIMPGTRWQSVATAYDATVAVRQDGTLWLWGNWQLTPLQVGTLATWQTVSASAYHFLALQQNGSLWAWGGNGAGQLGTEDNTDPSVPTQVKPGTVWKSVSAGGRQSVGVQQNGTLWHWGEYVPREAGASHTPHQVQPGTKWRSATAGFYHVAGVREDGSLWTWGDNEYGQLGDGTTLLRSRLGSISYEMPYNVAPGAAWQSALAVGAHTLAVRQDGSVWSWGLGDDGQIGSPALFTDTVKTPSQLFGPVWRTISPGPTHTVAVRQDGTLWAWGNNTYGQLGNGTTVAAARPMQVGSLATWHSASAGTGYTVAIQQNGSLWTWGNNSNGQLGDGTTTSRLKPWPLDSLRPGVQWASVSAGPNYVLALNTYGDLWAWGNNEYGQLGLGDKVQRLRPDYIGGGFRQVAAGRGHVVALTESGRLWAWGLNSSGQLGNNTTVSVLKAASVYLPDFPGKWREIRAGDSHTVATGEDGSLWSWGNNAAGQLGDSTTASQMMPVRIGRALDWQTVAAGADYTLATRQDGSLWAWGENSSGQLGTGNKVSRLQPTRVLSATKWQAVAGSGSASAAVQQNGLISTWGSNQAVAPTTLATSWWQVSGGSFFSAGLQTDSTLHIWGTKQSVQSGYGPITISQTRFGPTQIAAGSKWQRVSCGWESFAAIRQDGTLWSWRDEWLRRNNPSPGPELIQVGTAADWQTVSAGAGGFTMALKKDGSLWGWGYNTSGRAVPGADRAVYTPTPVLPAERWQSVSAGYSHTAAIRQDGSLWTWGDNQHGLLGNGIADSQQNGPFHVAPGTKWKSVSAGNWHTMAIRDDGTLWGWGTIYYQTLGNGTQAVSLVPVQIAPGTTWKSVQAGRGITMAIRQDGSSWVWGALNEESVVGNPNATDRLSPKQMTAPGNWAGYGSGLDQALVIDQQGTLWVWGSNKYGQLGQASRSSVPLLVTIGGQVITATAASVPQPATPPLVAWPVPFGSEGVQVRIQPAQAGPAVISLLSATGQLLWSDTVPVSATPTTLPIPPSGTLKPGMYLLRLQQGAQRSMLRLIRE